MPLDMQETRLADIASWLRIVPVPNEVLAAHKIAEVKRHPGSWWYRHAKLGTWVVVSTFLVSITGIMVCFLFTAVGTRYHHPHQVFWSAGLMGLFFAISTWINVKGFFRVRGVEAHGPAHWSEFTVKGWPALRTRWDIPQSMQETADIILRAVPDVQIIWGKLIQDSVVIDPYLVVRRGDDEICIGIWDDRGIIHEATLD